MIKGRRIRVVGPMLPEKKEIMAVYQWSTLKENKKAYGVKRASQGTTCVGHIQKPGDCIRPLAITLRILVPCAVVLQLGYVPTPLVSPVTGVHKRRWAQATADHNLPRRLPEVQGTDDPFHHRKHLEARVIAFPRIRGSTRLVVRGSWSG